MSQNKPSEVAAALTSELKQPIATKAHSPLTSKRWRWAKGFLTYLIIFLVIYTAVNWWRQPVMPAHPNLQLTDYQGQQIDIAAMSHNAPVLVYFWGSWCGVCSMTSPTVNSLAQSSPYPVVSIAVKSGSNKTLNDYMTAKGFEFATINDDSGEIFSAWQGQVTPSYVILKDGVMTQGLTGLQPEWSLRLRLWLSSLG